MFLDLSLGDILRYLDWYLGGKFWSTSAIDGYVAKVREGAKSNALNVFPLCSILSLDKGRKQGFYKTVCMTWNEEIFYRYKHRVE